MSRGLKEIRKREGWSERSEGASLGMGQKGKAWSRGGQGRERGLPRGSRRGVRAKDKERGIDGGVWRGTKTISTRTSRRVTYTITIRALRRLTSEFGWDRVR